MANTNNESKSINPERELSYDGIDEAVLVHALYHGTRALGFGVLHDVGGLTVDDVRTDIAGMTPRAPYGIPPNIPGGLGDSTGGVLSFDYYRGRPLKCSIDTGRKAVTFGLYDRDAGSGKMARIIFALRTGNSQS